MRNNIQIQSIKDDLSLQVIRLNKFFDSSSLSPHRQSFFMLLLTTKGTGVHRINYITYELNPGSVFFTHEGQVHQMVRFPQDGWVIIFKHNLFQQYINRYPDQEQSGPYDFFTRLPYVQLDASILKHFNEVICLLHQQVNAQPNSRVLVNYLSILLFYTYQAYSGTHQFITNSFQSEQLRKLKLLIDKHYKTQRKAPFYSDQLGLSTRKLNEITTHVFGKLVQDMILDRLLSECETLLGSTNLSMKEIIFELGFIDHSHFAYFFKKTKGITPSLFRKQLTGHVNNNFLSFNP